MSSFQTFSDNEKMYINAFWLCRRMTGERLRQIKSYSSSFKDAWERLTVSELVNAGIKSEAAEFIRKSADKINPGKEWEKIQKLGIQLVINGERDYPELLAQIHSAPQLLYVRGNLKYKENESVAIVGSRVPSTYGRQVVDKFAGELAVAGFAIISGLALGVDALSHIAALKTGGKVIAVLGNGLDRIYPTSNEGLAKRILETDGAIISEFPLGTPPLRQNFPARNRIISGLARGTLIIEAAESSGTLITAAFALEQNREIFSVPGSIFSEKSVGTNNLIKKTSAIPVTSSEDIFEAFHMVTATEPRKNVKLDDPMEQKIYDILGNEPKPIDELVVESELLAATLSATLTLLELRGVVKNMGGGRWVRM